VINANSIHGGRGYVEKSAYVEVVVWFSVCFQRCDLRTAPWIATAIWRNWRIVWSELDPFNCESTNLTNSSDVLHRESENWAAHSVRQTLIRWVAVVVVMYFCF